MQENLDIGVTSVGITLGTSGTDVNVTGSPITSSGNITINLPTASATNRGALSSADWITFNSKQPAGNYVTLDTTQTITAQKVFNTSGSSDSVIISHGSGSGIALDVIKAGNSEAIRVTKTSGSGNAMTISGGNFEAGTIVKTGGTSSQFLKADGSVDSSTYLTTGTAASTYITIATPTTITGVKTFDTGSLILAAAGTANSTHLRNSAGDSTSVSGSNVFGFNQSNKIYVTTQSNGGFILDFSNSTSNRIYTLKDASGTLAFTSDISTAVAGYVTIATSESITGLKTFTNSIILKNSPSLPGFIMSSYSANALEIGATISGTTYYSSFVFPAGAQSWNLPNASGTLALTSNLSAYLPLTGGTLTGALNGTSASFTGAFELNTAGTGALGFFGANNTTDKYLRIRNSSGNFELGTSSSEHYLIGNGSIPLKFYTNGTPRLTIDGSTGAATFSSSVTSQQSNITADGAGVVLQGYVDNNLRIAVRGSGYNDGARGGLLASTADFSSSVQTGGDISLMNASGDISVRMKDSGGNADRVLLRQGTTNNVYLGDIDANGGKAIIRANGEDYLTILTAGNVGIGTASPTNLLHLTGSSATPSLRLGSVSAGFHWDIGRENATTGDFVFNQTSSGGSASERLRITSNGITFNGDTAAANALDDYEEGTWTMGVSFGGASVGVTYGARTGTYTKIGRQVTVNGYILLSNKGTSTGSASITGLPFGIPNALSNYSAPSLFLDKITFANQYAGVGSINTTTIGLLECTEAGGVSSLNDANFANTSEIILSFTYFV
jgi:hypothetical protein